MPRGRDLELQTDLAGERAVSGFGRDLAEGAGIDIQVRDPRCRVIENIASVNPECDAPRFGEADLLLKVRVEVTKYW